MTDPGLRRIGPGAYDDGRGGLHVDVGEMLRAHGFADTPENRETLARVAEEGIRARSPETRVTRTYEAVCIRCGCTDHHACPGGCAWLRLDRLRGLGICTSCERSQPIGFLGVPPLTPEDLIEARRKGFPSA